MSTPDTSTLAGKIQVMQAALEGKPIQYRHRNTNEWRGPLTWGNPDEMLFNWNDRDYRIKPTEPLRIWFNVYGHNELGSAYSTREYAERASRLDALRTSEFIELTDEVEAALVAAGLIGGDA